jgi:SAM-dependent methyltransferase
MVPSRQDPSPRDETSLNRLTPINWDVSWHRQRVALLQKQAQALSIRRLREAITAFLPKAPFDALELGAGGSLWLSFLAGQGARVFGIDLSAPGLLLSCQLNQAANIQAHLIRGNVLELPLRDSSFDLVFSAGLVEHFDPPAPLLDKTFQLLKPGGTAITLVPNKRGIARILDRWLHPDSFGGHILFVPEKLAEAHRQSGLIPLQAQYLGCFYFGARAPEKGLLRLPYRIMRRLITAGLYWLMDSLRWYPESQTFSPSILVVAKRPER